MITRVSELKNPIIGSQVVASRSVLGINVATEARSRSKSRTLEENDRVS